MLEMAAKVPNGASLERLERAKVLTLSSKPDA
jgi:hypothetical protein